MSSTGYCGFSKVYDRLMADYPYSAVLRFIGEKIELRAKRGLDLCAGTGTVTVALSEAGAEMTAFDIEPEMLSAAREKAAKKGQKIRFIQGDINEIPAMKPFDFIVSVCDGVNYVKDPAAFAKSLCRLLKAGGIAVLEFSTLYKAEQILADNLFYEDGEDATWFFQNDYDAETRSVFQNLTIFQKQNDGRYLRTDDESRQYFYPENALEKAFFDAGFSRVLRYGTGDFLPPDGTAERLTLVLSKE